MNADLGLLILRVGAGAMMLTHGWPKLQKLLHGDLKFADPIGIGAPATLVVAVLSEFLCSALVVVGYKTRLAALPVVATMAVASGIVHRADPWGEKELAALYAVTFLAIALLGGGRFALDSRFGLKKKRK
jgi:putative oxidoreductase